jgi:hypothetical protein
MTSNAFYFARRAAEEESRAARAITQAAAHRHAQLARSFRQKLAGTTTAQTALS